MIHLAYFSYVYVCCYVMQINYCYWLWLIKLTSLGRWLINDSAVEMLHDSALYKFMIDIDIDIDI